jgi:hypothetical protein
VNLGSRMPMNSAFGQNPAAGSTVPAEVDVAEQNSTTAARTRNAKRWAGAAGCIGAAAAIAAHAASANFSGGSNVDQSAATNAGNLYLTVPGNGSTNRMTLTVDGLYPANIDNSTPWRERVINVTNAGNLNLATYSITSQASASNALTNQTGQGLVMIVDECSNSWTEGGTVAEPTYTCGGSQADVLGCASCNGGVPTDYDVANGTSPVAYTTSGSPALANISTTAAAVNHLRFRFKLAWNAPSNAQGLSVNVTFTFDGTQRAGTSA